VIKSVNQKTTYWLALLAVLAVALWFRINGFVTGLPFWLDEAYSAYAADKGFEFIFTVLPRYETHPPFYSALLSAWTKIVGNSLFGFRSLGLVAGVLALPLFWLAGREVARAVGAEPRIVGLASLAMAAVLPAVVDITRLVRPYALITLAYLFGIWALFGVARVHAQTHTLSGRYWRFYLLSLALLFWLHNLGALYVAGLGLALLVLIGPVVLIRDHPKQFLLGHLTVALIAAPAFYILADQAPTWAKSTWLTFNPNVALKMLFPIYGLAGLGGFACAGVLIAYGWEKIRIRPLTALILLATIPVIFSFALSALITPVFIPRTLVPVSAALILLVAVGAATKSLVPRVTFAILWVLSATQMVGIQTLKSPENWYGAIAWLEQRVQPGDVIYAYPNEGALPLSYALRDKGLTYPIRPIPEAVPSHDPTGWYPTGSRGVVSLPQYRLQEIADDVQSKRVPTVWLLRLGPAAYDKGDGFVKALARTRTVVGIWHQEPIHIIGLRQSPQITPREKPKP
jgi:mannosyltransferase